MHLKFEQKFPKAVVEEYGERMIKEAFANRIGEVVLETVRLTAEDPNEHLTTEQFHRMATNYLRVPEVYYRAEVIHLPAQQWEHIRGMLAILAQSSSEAKQIVRTIIDEVENK